MSHSWWYLSRASGLVAWALLAGAVLWGLLLSTRVFDRNPSPKWFTDLHRFLGGSAVVFVAIHVGTILADTYVHFGPAAVLVPLASKWHPVAVAWGVIAMWLLAAVEVSSLAMRHLPRRAWRAIHMSSYALFVSATLHGLSAGPDTRKQVFELVLSATLAVVTLLVLVRIATRKSKARPRKPETASRPAALLDESREAAVR